MSVLPLHQDEEVVFLRSEVRRLQALTDSMTEAMTGMQYAKELERFHLLDGLKDNLCPCCGGAVNVVDNGHGTGVKIESRW